MPSAAARVSINGGANKTIADKPIQAPSAATIQFSAADTSFWTQQRWELYAYPDGFTEPAGWDTDANGVIFSTDVTPSSFTLPSNTDYWGKWGLRLTVNNGLVNGVSDSTMVDETLAFELLSPSGLHDLMDLESNQFKSDWVKDIQENLRTVEGYDGTYGKIYSRTDVVTTSNATATVIASIPLPDDGIITFDFECTASRQTNATKGGRWKGSVTYRMSAGTATIVGAADYATPHETDAGMDVLFNVSVPNMQIKVTGVAANDIKWLCETRVQMSYV